MVKRPPKSPRPPKARRGAAWTPALLWVLPVLLAGLANVGVLRNDFAYDDVRVIEALRGDRIGFFGEPALGAGPDAALHAPGIRDQDTRPLTYAVHRLDHRLWGDAPFGFHLTNLLLHMLATGLVFAAAFTISRTGLAALLAALVFAVHPIHVEVVASFTNRKEILALIFGLAAFLAWLRVRPLVPRLLATGGLLLLGIAAKEVAVIGLPLILLATPNGLGREGGEKEPRPWQVWTLRLFAGALGMLIVAGLVMGESLPLFNAADIAGATEQQLHDYPAAFANALLGLLRIVGHLVLPIGLSAEYPIALNASPGSPALWLGLVVLVSLVVLPLALHRRHPAAALAAGWLIVMYLPISNLVPLVHFFGADRYAYVPSFGYCVLVGLAIVALHRRAAANQNRARAIVAVVAVMLGLLTVQTMRRVADWKNDLTLWSSAAREGFETYRIRHNLGVALLQAGDANADAAVRELTRAIELQPGRIEDHRWLTGAFFASNRPEDALRAANTALALDSTDAVCRFIRGEVLLQRGDSTRALSDYQAAIASDSSHFGATMRVAMIAVARAVDRPEELEEALMLARRAERTASVSAPGFQPQARALVEQVEELIRLRGR